MKAELTCYNLKAIAALYKVDKRTFKNMLKNHKIEISKKGRIFTILDVENIFNVLGQPDKN